MPSRTAQLLTGPPIGTALEQLMVPRYSTPETMSHRRVDLDAAQELSDSEVMPTRQSSHAPTSS